MHIPIAKYLFLQQSKPRGLRPIAVGPFSIRGALSYRADLIVGIFGIATVIGIWCLLTYSGRVQTLFLPKPSGIWGGLIEFHDRNWLFPAIWRSFWRVSKSLLLVVVVGLPVGILMGTFTPIDALLRKIINGVKSVPTTGIAGLIVLWFGIEERAKIMFLFLSAIFYMIILIKNAVRSVNEEYVRVALDIGANRRQMIWRVLLPGALPQIWDALAVCNGIMWTYIVLAEFLNSNEEQLGLGYLLYIGSKNQSSGKVFGTLVIIAVISSFTDFAFLGIRKRYFNW